LTETPPGEAKSHWSVSTHEKLRAKDSSIDYFKPTKNFHLTQNKEKKWARKNTE